MLVILHIVATLALALYALHEGVLLLLFVRFARSQPATIAAVVSDPTLPAVTVQIPLFNEAEVALRVIAAACELHYPGDRLQIQVLDDSTDETCCIASTAVNMWQSRGVNVNYLHRQNRDGYKAGAMASALCSATGEFIGIFDADFSPAPDWLLRTIPHFAPYCSSGQGPTAPSYTSRPVGFVQTCWLHINREANAVTRAQSMMLDMHFMVEQPARSATGLLMNFNGTGGMWRRDCIISAGGWQDDTLAEDLDLSYRALLAGWRGLFVNDIAAPGEVIPKFGAFKSQQARWSRGSAQNFRKLAPRILRADIPVHMKVAGLLHLSGYLLHLFLLIMTITVPLTALLPAGALPPWLGIFTVNGSLPLITMLAAHCARGRRLTWFMRDVPMAVMFGVGMSVSNALGWLRGFFIHETGRWMQSPKGTRAIGSGPSRHWPVDPLIGVEIMLGAYVVGMGVYLGSLGLWFGAVTCALYAFGYLGVSLMQVLRR